MLFRSAFSCLFCVPVVVVEVKNAWMVTIKFFNSVNDLLGFNVFRLDTEPIGSYYGISVDCLV